MAETGVAAPAAGRTAPGPRQRGPLGLVRERRRDPIGLFSRLARELGWRPLGDD